MKNKNYCIILAGGIGSKLWPMSTDSLPKQFLDLFATGRTMLQITYDRYSKLVPKENIFISTYKDYVDIVRQQLPEISPYQIVSEPLQLSTAPATALTLVHLIAREPDATVISAPADQLIYDPEAFEQQMREGLRFVDATKDFLAIGIKPTRPATSYGYLQASVDTKDSFFKLKSFTEKPDIDFARLFCESGEFYWSTGIFIWNTQTMLQAMRKDYPYIENMAGIARGNTNTGITIDSDAVQHLITEQYPRIRFQSLDLLILEHHTNVYIAPCTFGWADVGSWKNYYDLHEKDEDLNVICNSQHLLYSCKNNLVKASTDKVVILQDLEGYMVVENDKMLLICKKDDPSLVRRIMNDAQMKFGNDIM
ncbi:MAG: mannose-1-phosphate guanylyltransferase [Bacteroidaceae bacterium]|nr:mannose-1-phosphate guanylyltransferase [Bacteroidaceae bacterium]